MVWQIVLYLGGCFFFGVGLPFMKEERNEKGEEQEIDADKESDKPFFRRSTSSPSPQKRYTKHFSYVFGYERALESIC